MPETDRLLTILNDSIVTLKKTSELYHGMADLRRRQGWFSWMRYEAMAYQIELEVAKTEAMIAGLDK